jgi:outer membrane protein assembly factor BamB
MKMITSGIAFLIFFFVGIQGHALPQNATPSSFSMYRNNPQLTGASNEKPVYKLKGIIFTYKAGGPIRGIPAIYNETIYFGCGDGYFYALNSQTGEERWRYKTSGAIYSSPYVSVQALYFTSRDNYLYALEPGGGKEIWKFKMGPDLGTENYWDNYLSSPVVVGNTLYVGSGDGNLYAIDKTSGQAIWAYHSGARIRTTPAIFENHIVFGNNAGLLIDVNRNTGKMQWQFKTDGASNNFGLKNNDTKSVFCSPSISDGIVVSGGRDAIIYALDLTTGKEKWRNNHKGPWILSTAIKNGTVFVGCGSDLLVQALDLQSGLEKWKFRAASAIFSSLTLAGDLVYFNDLALTGNLHAINTLTGKELWCFPMADRSFSTPVIANGIVYNADENGMLYALQSAPASSETAPVTAPKKIVYWQGKLAKNDFTDFQNGIDQYIRDYFIGNGYKLVDEKELAAIMREQTALTTKSENAATGNSLKSVIVFADNRFPPSIVNDKTGKPLVLQYLEAGGKIALFGLNPIAYTRDSTGIVISYDDSIPSVVFGLKYPEKNFIRGIYETHITPEGRAVGLSSTYSTVSNFSVIEPGNAITVLAKDEFGSATEWIKNFGGPEGTGLLQFNIPTNEVKFNMSEFRTVIEWGVCW